MPAHQTDKDARFLVVGAMVALTIAAGGARPASAAQPSPAAYGPLRTLLSGPAAILGIAADSGGDVFLAYSNTEQVVEVSKAGAQTVLPFPHLGLPFVGIPNGVAVDAAGDVFVSELGSNTVLKLPTGGREAVLSFRGILNGSPGGIAVDGAGDLFLADTGDNRVVELTTGGSLVTLAFAGIAQPTAVAVDTAGDVFVVDTGHKRLVELTKGGVETTVHVAGQSPPTGVAVDANGDVFVSASLPAVDELRAGGGQIELPFSGVSVSAVAVDGTGDVFVADQQDNLVEELPRGAAPARVPPNAIISFPNGVAADSAGDAFVTDLVGQVVEIPNGGVPVRLPIFGLSDPTGVAVDGAGDLFVADTGNHRIVELPKGGAQVTLPAHGLAAPTAIAVDAKGDVFITDTTLKEVFELPSGGGPKIALPLTVTNPMSVAVDGDGNVFVANVGLTLDEEVIFVPQLLELPRGGAQTVLTIPNIANVLSVAVDHAGDLFMSGVPNEGSNDYVAVLPRGSSPASAIGLPVTAYSDGMAVDPTGDIFLIERNFNLVRELPLKQAVPSAPTPRAPGPAPSIGPALPLTGDNTSIPLAGAACLIVLALGAHHLRRRNEHAPTVDRGVAVTIRACSPGTAPARRSRFAWSRRTTQSAP